MKCSISIQFLIFLVFLTSCASNSAVGHRHEYGGINPQLATEENYICQPYEYVSFKKKHPTPPIIPPICPPEPNFAPPLYPFKGCPVSHLIVLDAGHGGEDFGTHSLGNPKYQEKYLNMSTTLLVKKFLEQYGYQVTLTRNNDSFISLEKRAEFANELKPAIFVSIHYNSAPSREAEGIEVYYFKSEANKARTSQSKTLAKAVLNKVLIHTEAKSRGVKHGNFAVIRETKMPAILIEGGFLTNTSEMEKLKKPAYLKSLALGIAQGIKDYLTKDNLMSH